MRPIVLFPVAIMLILAIFLAVTFLKMAKEIKNTFPADTGPTEINVSKYPVEMQTAYRVFQNKCSQCHTLARPINTDFSPERWREYVNKMRNKAGSGITQKTADQISEFLIYDSKIRKNQNN